MDLFAKMLRARARELDLTDTEVARRAGLQTARFNHYVTGRREPDLQTIVRICRVLNTTPNDLLGFDADEPENKERGNLETRLLASGKQLTDANLKLAIDQIELLLKHQ